MVLPFPRPKFERERSIDKALLNYSTGLLGLGLDRKGASLLLCTRVNKPGGNFFREIFTRVKGVPYADCTDKT